MSALDVLANRIGAHLVGFAKNPEIAEGAWTDANGKSQKTVLYYRPGAFRAGRRVKVHYVSYQYGLSLTKAEAETYLAWLDAGNVGRHYEAVAAK